VQVLEGFDPFACLVRMVNNIFRTAFETARKHANLPDVVAGLSGLKPKSDIAIFYR
jgi:hypothetical protein